MAKRSKAKAKRAKTVKTKKAKTASKTKKPTKTIRRTGTDPCAAKQQAFEDAQLVVDDLTNEINDPDIPPAERVKAEGKLRTATIRLGTAQRALEQCRRQHP
jgi:hypothetical protein